MPSAQARLTCGYSYSSICKSLSAKHAMSCTCKKFLQIKLGAWIFTSSFFKNLCILVKQQASATTSVYYRGHAQIYMIKSKRFFFKKFFATILCQALVILNGFFAEFIKRAMRGKIEFPRQPALNFLLRHHCFDKNL